MAALVSRSWEVPQVQVLPDAEFARDPGKFRSPRATLTLVHSQPMEMGTS